MTLKLVDDWTQTYYEAIQDYFWEPALFGRKPNGDPKPWSHWEERLRRLEVPLNHILSQFFALAPQDTVDAVLSGLARSPLKGFRLASEPSLGSELGKSFTQPDFVFAGDSELVFLEMKIDTPSSMDQFAKYALSAERVCALHPHLKQARLVILARTSDERRLWGDKRVTDEATLRAQAIRGLQGEPGVWKQQGMQTFMAKSSAEDRERLVQRIQSLVLSVSTYGTFVETLSSHTPPDPTAAKLIDGVLVEIRRRGLVEPARTT